jgi:hypothetical protein
MKKRVLRLGLISIFLVITSAFAETGTNLDKFVNIINSDRGLKISVPSNRLAIASESIKKLNSILIEALKQTNSLNKDVIHVSDMYKVIRYIKQNYHHMWLKAYGSEKWYKLKRLGWRVSDASQSGIHYVNNNGATSRILGLSAVQEIIYPIYSFYTLADMSIQNIKNKSDKALAYTKWNKRVEKATEMLNKILIYKDIRN